MIVLIKYTLKNFYFKVIRFNKFKFENKFKKIKKASEKKISELFKKV